MANKEEISKELAKKFKLSWEEMIRATNIFKILIKAEPYFKKEIAKQIFDDLNKLKFEAFNQDDDSIGLIIGKKEIKKLKQKYGVKEQYGRNI